MTVWRVARCPRPCDRLLSPLSVMQSHLTVRANEASHNCYCLRLRVIVWRAARCLKPCDRLSSPSSVMFWQLIIRVNEMSSSYRYSLLSEVKSESMKTCKIPKTL